jgi:hypothetical protein
MPLVGLLMLLVWAAHFDGTGSSQAASSSSSNRSSSRSPRVAGEETGDGDVSMAAAADYRAALLQLLGGPGGGSTPAELHALTVLVRRY